MRRKAIDEWELTVKAPHLPKAHARSWTCKELAQCLARVFVCVWGYL